MFKFSTAFVFLVLALSLAPSTSDATHFRFGHITWVADGNDVEVRIQNAWRRDSGGNPCVDLVTETVTTCSPGDGLPQVGDVIREGQGGTVFDWGDGSPLVGSPLGPLLYLVTAIDPANNWLSGFALDPASLPTIDDTLSHTYATAGDFTARIDSCCRISAVAGVNEHINNPGGDYRVETVINAGTTNASPVSALAPIINCPKEATCSFLVPGAGGTGPLGFRLSTSVEAGTGAFIQPGVPQAPNNASIGSLDGLYTWDTTGATLAGNAANNTLYSTQVTIEDATSRVAIDFLISLVEEDPTPPVIVPPAGSPPVCFTTQVLTTGVTKTFDVVASDPDPTDVVTLNISGLPVGAAMSPTLPIAGNPVTSMFSWTPGPTQLGIQVISFSASSTGGGFVLCPVTLEVIEQIAVDIDIKPFSFPNSISLRDMGFIPVAILSTADFDAPGTVDQSSLTFGRTGVEAGVHRCGRAGEDANGDGLLDLVCTFPAQDTGFQIGDTVGILKGQTLDGIPIEGSDSVRILVR